MDSKMDFDEEMSSLQIEDLGEYFLQTDLGDSWKGLGLGYADEDKQQAPNAAADAKLADALGNRTSTSSTASSSSGLSQLTSPPLASITEMLRQGGAGPAPSYGSPRKDFAALFQSIAAAGGPAAAVAAHAAAMGKAAGGDVSMSDHSADEAMDLNNFSLDALRKSALMTGKGSLPFGGPFKAPGAVQPSPQCQNIMSLDSADPKDLPDLSANLLRRSSSAMGGQEEDRGYRKKSREKMRRQEVNVKFDELVDLLGLSNRVRKSAILQEAVSAIKALKREREEMRRDRDRLQQEVSKLATCLQYSHLGSVAAANAVAMTHGGQPQHQMQHVGSSHQLQQLNAASNVSSAAIPASAHTHPMHVQCAPGNNCFPIGGTFGNFSTPAHSSGMMAQTTTSPGTISIAPKALKPAPTTAGTNAATFKPIAPDTQPKP